MTAYWNPLASARRIVEAAGRDCFTGNWAERNWRNVPGPFYGAATDSMAIGRLDAPDHIAYDNDFGDGFGTEFVYRQPVNETEVESLVSAAQLELYSGYAWDGDEHWTVAAVRDWWRNRGRVRAWAVDLAAEWSENTHPQFRGHYHDAAQGLRDYVTYIDGGLASYLRGYHFWLSDSREPRDGEALPEL
ncbi:ferredoxin [Streptomyces sp. SYSU K21746]